ncbi:MAG: two-component system response regulator AtoC, partial [Urechidicola sp.]
MKGFKIFIVEDNTWYSDLLKYHLELNPEYEVKTFDSGKKMLQALHERPNVVT